MIYLSTRPEPPRGIAPGQEAHCISPYLNPAHVLAPPRAWLEALGRGEYPWAFFRLRYRTLLRERFREEPEPFFRLLDASEGERVLTLACPCGQEHCHGEPARDFLETLRGQAPYARWRRLRPARRLPPRLPAGGLALLTLRPGA